MKVYDLTPPIHPGLAVFPGDQAYRRQIAMDFKQGQHLQLSSYQTTFHLGAHADSSSHYHADGKGVDQRPLQSFAGNAQVIKVKIPSGERIYPRHLDGISIQAGRVLFSTGSFPNPDVWNSDFNSLSPELVHWLAEQKVLLVGIDTPSVDPETSKGLESHQALYQTGLSVLEGLVLNSVPEGVYSLVAFPLPFVDADASPVRALLFDQADLFPEDPWDLQG